MLLRQEWHPNHKACFRRSAITALGGVQADQASIQMPKYHAPFSVQAEENLLKGSPFKTLDALITVFEDFKDGTGVLYLRTKPQSGRGNLLPYEVDGLRDIRDQESGKTMRAYLGQTYLFHEAFRWTDHLSDCCMTSHGTKNSQRLLCACSTHINATVVGPCHCLWCLSVKSSSLCSLLPFLLSIYWSAFSVTLNSVLHRKHKFFQEHM